MIWKPLLEIHDSQEGERIVIINQLYNVRLYAYYVVEVSRFEDGDIEGTLMTRPFEFHGPFTTEEEARRMVFDLLST